jgi:hypothetical protein
MQKWVATNWERVLFAGLGLVFFGFSLSYMYSASVTASSAAFVMGFMSFVFSSVARFKRFKGLGFEAELWEDKQREAAELIDRLKDIVAIYSREVILSKVTSGRLGNGKGQWGEHWALYDGLTRQHDTLGQRIDFSDLKKEMDLYFVFDMSLHLMEGIRDPIWKGAAVARQKISEEFGSPVTDLEGHNARHSQMREVQTEFKDPLEVARRENLPEAILLWGKQAQMKLKKHFDIEISFDQETLSKLAEASAAYSNQPIKITDRLVALANGET